MYVNDKLPHFDAEAAPNESDQRAGEVEALSVEPRQYIQEAFDACPLSSEHAVIAKEQTAQAIANTASASEESGVEAALSEAFHEEYSRLYQHAKASHSDPCLQHFSASKVKHPKGQFPSGTV
ncbi:hypothetical protein ACRRTK_021597 [Alexandromys fortis]